MLEYFYDRTLPVWDVEKARQICSFQAWNMLECKELKANYRLNKKDYQKQLGLDKQGSF